MTLAVPTLLKGLAITFAGFFTSCASKDFSTTADPASLRLEWTGGGLNYDRINFVSGDRIGDVEQKMRGSKGPFLLDPGEHRFGFRYFGNRGSIGAPSENLRTAVGTVAARLEAGGEYLVRSSVAGPSVTFSVVEESTGRALAQSPPVQTKHLPIKIGPMPYTPIPPVLLR